MSDNIPRLTVKLLSEELKNVYDWYVFGVALGIPVSKLDCIKSQKPFDTAESWKISMYSVWLRANADASWKQVVQALEQTSNLDLAAAVKRKYLLTRDTNEEGKEFEAEVHADATVVRQLRDLETSYGLMLGNFGSILTDFSSEFSKARTFLNRVCGSREFSDCRDIDELIDQLCQGYHIDPFNVYRLKSLLKIFESEKESLTKIIEKYEEEKEVFLKRTTILKFQRAVVRRANPALKKGHKMTAKLTIKVSPSFATNQTLWDIKNLAMKGFKECHQRFVRMHAEPGSVIISWVFSVALSGKLEHLARENAAVFKDAGVEEVTVGGRVVFPCTLEEDIPTASLKEIYIDFYHRLVEAVSDEHTCRSLLTQLSSPALISEEKIAQLTSSKVTGSSFLKTLGLEEEPHLLVPLVSAMSGVEQLQTLAENMSAVMRSKQGSADIENTVDATQERQQLEADIERLTSDKADLLTRLRCCEEDLKTANELSTMKERALSGMLAATGRGDTGVKELEETIKQKSVSDIAVQTTTEEGLVPLPAGWEACTAPNSHVFYADHNTQTTQWQDPRTIEQYQLPSLDLPTLPAYNETPDIPQPTIALVLEVLKVVSSKWYELGVYLGVDVNNLNKIKQLKNFAPDFEGLSMMISYWINEDKDVSWENLAQALDHCNLTDTARALKKKYILQVVDENVIIEIRPDSTTIVQTLQSLECSFSHLLTKLEDLHRPGYFEKGQLFLNSLFGTFEFNMAQKSKRLLERLSSNHLDTFNIDYLRKYVSIFDNEQMIKVTDEYEEEKEQFLTSAAVRDFQQAVVSKVESVSTGDVAVDITVPKCYATKRTLDDIVKLALLGLEGSNKPQVRVQASAL